VNCDFDCGACADDDNSLPCRTIASACSLQHKLCAYVACTDCSHFFALTCWLHSEVPLVSRGWHDCAVSAHADHELLADAGFSQVLKVRSSVEQTVCRSLTSKLARGGVGRGCIFYYWELHRPRAFSEIMVQDWFVLSPCKTLNNDDLTRHSYMSAIRRSFKIWVLFPALPGTVSRIGRVPRRYRPQCSRCAV
jgi:hypothetical protein